MSTAWIGLGGNLGDSAARLDTALEAMERCADIVVEAVSSYCLSAPWGKLDQPDFVNAVARIETSLPAEALLDRLLEIETALGRVRESRWGPRLIDLDLLLYGGVRMQSAVLTLPHPHLHERAFVLVPLLELAPEIIIPGHGRADELLAALGDNERLDVRPGPQSRFRPAVQRRGSSL